MGAAAEGIDRSSGHTGTGGTYPFCCGALSAGGGAPKGLAVLLREALGEKVYRGGSAVGARAWAGDRARQGRGAVGGGSPSLQGQEDGVL